MASGMDKKNAYNRPVLPEAERFFAKRVRNWVMHPELALQLYEGDKETNAHYRIFAEVIRIE